MLKEKILESYNRVKSDHSRGRDYVEFEIDRELKLELLLNQIIERSFVLEPYTFIVLRPKPREVFACTCPARIIQRYAGQILIDYLDRFLPDSVYSNRVGMGTLAAVDKVIEYTRDLTDNFDKSSDVWIIKLDIKGFFPNAVRSIIFEKLKKLIVENYKGDDLEDLLYMVEVSIMTDATHNCEIRSSDRLRKLIAPEKSLFNKPEGIGGAIGYLIWQICMNFYSESVDRFIESLPDTKLVRFVDDRVIITKDKKLVLESIPRIRELLAEEGMKLSEDKFYCQHFTHGVEFLGYHIKYDRKYINKRIQQRIYWNIERFNQDKFITSANMEHVFATLNSYLGMMKYASDFKLAKKIISLISPKWFNFFTYNEERLCLEFRPEYSYYNRLTLYSGFKFDKTRSKKEIRKRKKKSRLKTVNRIILKSIDYDT